MHPLRLLHLRKECAEMVNDLLKRLGYGGATVLLVCLALVIGLAVGSRINEANAATTDVML